MTNTVSSFSPETVVIATDRHQIVGRVKQESSFCPDIAATPDGKQVWLTLKDVGKTMVFNARPPFDVVTISGQKELSCLTRPTIW